MTHPIVPALRAAMQAAADAEQAQAMRAYMKTDQPFYGIQADPRRAIFRAVRKEYPIHSRAEYEAAILALWQGVHREEQYQALEIAEQVKAFRTAEAWPLYTHLVHTATWWDTLDWIAGKIVSLLILKERRLEAHLVEWRQDASMWVRRASLLAHLRHKQQTNTALLAETILILAPEEEFFIRKAVGWVLREYAKSDPVWVQAFVREHAEQLSGLSRREALKNIGPG